MHRYAITSRVLYPGDDRQQQAALLRQTARWAAEGIEFIQLREKDLAAGVLADLAREILATLRGSASRLLINSRPDIAVAASAHGVHLTAAGGGLRPGHVRRLYLKAGLPIPLISVSCHTLEEAEQARDEEADAILFAPVFEKSTVGRIITPGAGLDRLREVCAAAAPVPVYALGGVTLQNAALCLEAGASGIAGVRLFQDHNP